MRIVHYYIVKKSTMERVFTSCSHSECVNKLAEMDNNQFGIAYKWLSI